LAEAVVYLPNRRSGRALAERLHTAMGRAVLLPDIRPLGDVDDPEAAGLGPHALDLPIETPPARRRGALARLIQAWRGQMGEPPLPPASALAAADALAALLDQSAIAGEVDWSKVIGLSLEGDLAAHWEVSSKFLQIAAETWPSWLGEQKAMDAMMRRRAAARALASRWAAAPPPHPVIVAGSTGATPSGRILMAAALALPRGAVVLPGLDSDLHDWAAVKEAPSHPQHALLCALDHLGLAPEAVRALPHLSPETPEAAARRRLINEALAPAESTPTWSARLRHLASPDPAEVLVRRGLRGLGVIEAEDDGEEALAAAVLMREVLETPGRSAALVTPDAGLGRRVSNLLRRWGVEAAPSAGLPLSRTPAGSLVLMLARWALDPGDPVVLLALLKHPLARLGREPEALQAETLRLELAALRGPRLWTDLDELAARLARSRNPDLARLVNDLSAVHAAARGAFDQETISGPQAAEACARMAETLAATPDDSTGAKVWAGPAGQKASHFLEQFAVLCEEMGLIETAIWPAFAEAAAGGVSAPPDGREHPRLAIWGPLEARLQQRDVMILGGLNEGVWPQAPAPDAFLNLKLRRSIGLAAPDERIGLAAHDFAHLANAPQVWLMRSKRSGDKPTVASRWLWRLRTLAAGGLGGREEAQELMDADGKRVLHWARALRAVEAVTPAAPPEPRPPRERRRLDRMSPSRAATLIRDPYSDYARRVLKLEPLRRVGEDIDAAARGTAVHAAVEDFEAGRAQSLEEAIINRLLQAGASPELIQLERPLWLRAANLYLQWRKARERDVRAAEIEAKAVLELPTRAGVVTLEARADRIELLSDGTLAIIDFKTGAAKTAKMVESGLEPQLPLEAAIAANTMFGSIGRAKTSQLIYFRLSTSRSVLRGDVGKPLTCKKQPSELAREALAGLVRLVEAFSSEQQPYLSRPRVLSVKTASDYDRLARRGEWSIGDEEP
jgi:ATP-dependent helicase/nuclease subunit B